NKNDLNTIKLLLDNDVIDTNFKFLTIPSLELLKLLISRGFKFDRDEINSIYDIEALEFLYSDGILPDTEGANNAARFNKLDTLVWIHGLNVDTDLNTINYVTIQMDINVFKWLINNCLYPNQDVIDNSYTYSKDDIFVSIFANNNFFPTN